MTWNIAAWINAGRQRSLVGSLVGAVTLAVLLLCAPLARGQQSSEITGTVTDATGAILVNATVTIKAASTGVVRTTQTNNSGAFDFGGLDVGNYNLSVTMAGFSVYRKNNIVVNVAETLREDVPLQTGSSTETITVEANALQVQSASNEISTLITGKQIEQLATNGRNVIALTSLGAGVSTTNPSFNGVTAQGSSFNLSFNGMRPDHNNWLIDGGEVYDRGSGGKLDVLPSPDVLDEFTILQSNYPPDYGISSGGTVSMVLKSGTRKFHGGAWEFIRNDALDAYPYFSKHTTPVQAKPELRLNIFGGAFGGPLWIPHLYNRNKDKTFFFVSEEWRRYIQGANPTEQNTMPAADFPVAGTPLVYVPTASEVAQQAGTSPNKCPNGALAYICVPQTASPKYAALYALDGLTPGAPFPNNTIPANLFDPNALLFLGTGAIPKPNSGGNLPQDQYIASPKQPTYVREDVVRVDHYFNEKYHLLGSWIHDAMSQTIIPTQWSGDSYSTVGDVFSNPSWAAVINLTQTLSPTLLNETALNVNGNTISVVPTGIYQQPAGWTAGSLFTGNNADNRLPQVAFSGGPLATTYTVIYWPWHNSFLDYQLRDDLTKVLGKNTVKVGFSYMRMDKNQQLQADTEGDYQFNANGFTKNSFANFITGFATTYTQLQSQRTDHYVNNTYSLYANDDWRATPRLTLNLGFRYDLLPHNYEKNNQLGNFNPASYSAANSQTPNASGYLNSSGAGFSTVNGQAFYLNGINLAGQNGTPAGLVKNDYGTFQPRVGFAYDVAGNGKTVIRGGFGLFYERVQGNDTYDIDTTPPFSYQPQLNNVFFSTPTVTTDGLTAAAPVGPAALTSLAVHYPNPGTIQFSLGIQKQIAPSVIFNVGYVGTNGWDQNDRREINDLPLSSSPQILAERQAVATSSAVGAVSPNANLYRPYLGYANIAQDENELNFSYDSLQTSLRMEAKHGLSLQVSYTWSHEIDIQSGDLTSSTLSGSGGALSNPYNVNYDRGSGNFDRRNILNFNYIYTPPWYLHDGNFVEHEFLGGWTLSGTTVAESGTPQNVNYGNDVLGLGGNTTNRPNLTGKVSYPKTQKAWFNKAAFTTPIAPWDPAAPAGDTGFGNAGKDSVVGPGLFNWNISIYKDFPLTSHEGPYLEFRAESYNTFNHTEFNAVDTGFTDGNFGQLTGTLDPRTLQFGLKIKF